jgi:hypothetical protein
MPYPLIGPKADEVILHEDLRCVLLSQQGDDGADVIAFWGLYGEAKTIAFAAQGDVTAVDAIGRAKPFEVAGGVVRFPVDPRCTYVTVAGLDREGLRALASEATVSGG